MLPISLIKHRLFKQSHLPILVVLIIIITYNLLSFSLSLERLALLTQEDGIIESLAAVSYLISASLLFYLFLNSKSEDHPYIFNRKRNPFFLFLSIIFIIFLGEEISWGQRIFNIESPDFFLNGNRQDEINIHNLNVWDAIYPTGEPKRGLIRFFSSVAMYSYFWFAYCLIIPFFSKFSAKAKNLTLRIGFPVIPLLYGILFIINFITFKLLEYSGIGMRPLVEVKETNFALLYLAASFTLLIIYRNK